MDGIIIFADNKVFDRDSFENQLFDKLRYESSLSILPVCSIECLEETIKTVSTFKALILDWNFISVILQTDMALLQETQLTACQ